MKISEHGLAIIKAFESCMKAIPSRPGYFKPYDDGVGVLTIGWGHTNHHEPKFDASAVWSQADCDAALILDLAIFDDHVNRLANVQLEQHEFDALVSWAFNTGGPASASLWRVLNAGNKAAIPANLAQWDKGTVNGRKVVLAGLTRRRKAEGLLFAGKIDDAYAVAQIKCPAVAPVTAGPTPAKPAATTTAPAQTGDKAPSAAPAKPGFWSSFFAALTKKG